MKLISKFLNQIRNNKDRVKKTVSIVIVSLATGPRYGRYGKTNSLPISLLSNSIQHVERLYSDIEKDIEVINKDSTVKNVLNHKSSSHLIKTGSRILIGNQQISEGSKSVLRTRSGDLSKSGPGARAKANACRNPQSEKYSSGSIIISGISKYTPQHVYCIYKEGGRLQGPTSKIEIGVPNFNDEVPPRIDASV